MRSKLAIKVDEYTGMRVGLVGLLCAFTGAGLGFTVLPTAGYWIGLTGALVVLLGIGMHWYKNWRSILHIDRK